MAIKLIERFQLVELGGALLQQRFGLVPTLATIGFQHGVVLGLQLLEFGLAGGVTLISLYLVLLIYGVAISLRCRNHFGRLLGIGVTTVFFLYVFINIAMVMGLIPVVGVPLPLISYGGTAMVTVLFGFGLLMNVYIHRDVDIGRRGVETEI